MKVMTHYSILMALSFICFNVGFAQADGIDKETAMEMLSNEAEKIGSSLTFQQTSLNSPNGKTSTTRIFRRSVSHHLSR